MSRIRTVILDPEHLIVMHAKMNNSMGLVSNISALILHILFKFYRVG